MTDHDDGYDGCTPCGNRDDDEANGYADEYAGDPLDDSEDSGFEDELEEEEDLDDYAEELPENSQPVQNGVESVGNHDTSHTQTQTQTPGGPADAADTTKPKAAIVTADEEKDFQATWKVVDMSFSINGSLLGMSSDLDKATFRVRDDKEYFEDGKQYVHGGIEIRSILNTFPVDFHLFVTGYESPQDRVKIYPSTGGPWYATTEKQMELMKAPTGSNSSYLKKFPKWTVQRMEEDINRFENDNLAVASMNNPICAYHNRFRARNKMPLLGPKDVPFPGKYMMPLDAVDSHLKYFTNVISNKLPMFTKNDFGLSIKRADRHTTADEASNWVNESVVGDSFSDSPARTDLIKAKLRQMGRVSGVARVHYREV
jgi:hypothetical protein